MAKQRFYNTINTSVVKKTAFTSLDGRIIVFPTFWEYSNSLNVVNNNDKKKTKKQRLCRNPRKRKLQAHKVARRQQKAVLKRFWSKRMRQKREKQKY